LFVSLQKVPTSIHHEVEDDEEENLALEIALVTQVVLT
jgi:hypothetical protein